MVKRARKLTSRRQMSSVRRDTVSYDTAKTNTGATVPVAPSDDGGDACSSIANFS